MSRCFQPQLTPVFTAASPLGGGSSDGFLECVHTGGWNRHARVRGGCGGAWSRYGRRSVLVAFRERNLGCRMPVPFLRPMFFSALLQRTVTNKVAKSGLNTTKYTISVTCCYYMGVSVVLAARLLATSGPSRCNRWWPEAVVAPRKVRSRGAGCRRIRACPAAVWLPFGYGPTGRRVDRGQCREVTPVGDGIRARSGTRNPSGGLPRGEVGPPTRHNGGRVTHHCRARRHLGC